MGLVICALQLVIVAVSKKHDDIADFFYMISVLFNVVGASCKRKDMIREKHREEVIKAIGSGQISTGTGLNQEQTLQRAGDTRWGSHYRTLSSLVKLFPSVMSILKYFDDRFNEVNSALLGHMASFTPKDSFAAFNLDSLVKLAEFYPDDFDSRKLDDLGPELRTYIDNVRVDERFANLDGIADLAKLMVETNKHITFPLVYHLLKLVLILPVATASVERCFSAMNVAADLVLGLGDVDDGSGIGGE
ncbi:uncharacterized protein LOC119273263 [Triticum dicoccoides]|uniref:uncharacterized protein LOC119273263 n=1 Tax=Triticum dicoccoides TaxID=85692 RepID=UPI00188E880B|nr:uncharacterized protein LOC119273263 [Triticum dicoccoides]